jgi:arabinofuranosyltransferase
MPPAVRPSHNLTPKRALTQRTSSGLVRTGQRITLLASLAIFLTIVLRTAWQSEDAYISFRVVWNVLHGHGLTWNIVERVQTYTDPLYVLLVTAATALVGNVYLASTLVSLVLTAVTYLLIMWRASAWNIVLGTAFLISSKGFMDFSISGLENPATHAAIAAFLWVWHQSRDPFRLTLIAGLAATNRMDSLLLFAPALAVVYWRLDWSARRRALFGFAPIVLWSLFSLWYYGFLFPNTAYAKLSTGIPKLDLWQQGVYYLWNAIRWDIVTVTGIASGLLVGILTADWALALGGMLYVAYTVNVGGDFMASRFLTAPLLVAVGLLVRHLAMDRRDALVVLALILIPGLCVPRPALLTGANYQVGDNYKVDIYGIADERAFYYHKSGLLRFQGGGIWDDSIRPAPYDPAKPMNFLIHGNIGYIGYEAGPQTFILDFFALGDPLLARLPIPKGHWRIGHYHRLIPAGYEETVRTGQNRIVDPKLAEYYEHLREATRGDLFSLHRLRTILLLNVGYYNHLLPKSEW